MILTRFERWRDDDHGLELAFHQSLEELGLLTRGDRVALGEREQLS
jgi:hypothetical protein